MSEAYLNCHTKEGRSLDVSISAESEYNKLRFPRKSCRFARNDNNRYHPSFSQENVMGSSNSKTNKSGNSLDLAFQLGAMTRRYCHVASLLTMTMVGLFSYNAHATCTPAPDCASIGYTETSCETKSVKCPFDTSKLFCLPCDSSFQYSCVGDNITGSTGSACGGKYASCECDTSLGYYFAKGVCACSDIIPTNCTVGAIYYADGRCSDDFVPCRNAIGVVVKDNELIMSRIVRKAWGADYSDIADIVNYVEKYLAKTDYEGKSNTTAIVAYYGENNEDIAGIYCYSYYPDGLESSKGNWYLPALGELFYVYENYEMLRTKIRLMNPHDYSGYGFWSSSEQSAINGWGIVVSNASGGASAKTDTYSVTCFLNIS